MDAGVQVAGKLPGKKAIESTTKAAEDVGVNLSLKYKAGWGLAQRAEAGAKVQILNNSATVVRQTQRGGTSARTMFMKAGGDVPVGSDVDHMVDLQLGGSHGCNAAWHVFNSPLPAWEGRRNPC